MYRFFIDDLPVAFKIHISKRSDNHDYTRTQQDTTMT